MYGQRLILGLPTPAGPTPVTGTCTAFSKLVTNWNCYQYNKIFKMYRILYFYMKFGIERRFECKMILNTIVIWLLRPISNIHLNIMVWFSIDQFDNAVVFDVISRHINFLLIPTFLVQM